MLLVIDTAASAGCRALGVEGAGSAQCGCKEMDLRLYRYIAGAAARSTHARATSPVESPVSAALLPPAPLNSYIIFSGQHGVPHEEEIYLDGQRAVWSTGHVAVSEDEESESEDFPSPPFTRVLKSFTHSEPILCALFTRFASLPSSSPSSSSSRPHLVLVHADSLSVHGAGGDIFSVPLPFRVAAALPLQEGLLLSRAPHLPAPAVALPCFFSLLHPLEEVKPVAQTLPAGAEGGSRSEYCCDEEERLVWSSDQEPLAVTFNARDGKHRLHIIRQSERERRKRWTGDGDDDVDADDSGWRDEQGADADAMMDAHDGIGPLPAFSGDAEAEDERLISSELLLEQAACVELAASQPASSVFLSAAADGRALVCLCIETTLFVFELQPAASSFSPFAIAAKPAFTLEALSACPTRPLFASASSAAHRAYHSDIVVLRPDYSIAVYSGQQLLLRLPSLQLPSPPLSLSHPVLSRLSLHTESDTYRITLPPATSNACVLQCMQALSYGVPLEEMLQLRRAWLMLKERESEEVQRESAVDRDWALFCSFIADAMGTAAAASNSPVLQSAASPAFPSASTFALQRPVSMSSPSRKSTRHTRELSQSPPPQLGAEDALDAWTQLLCSDFHHQHALDPVLHSLSASSHVPQRAVPGYAARDSKRQKMQPSVSSSFLLSAGSRPAALLMLHLLYEDCKLDALQQPSLGPLAALCTALAARLGAGEWCEWYARDFPELDGADAAAMAGHAPSLHPLLAQPPPSIFRWLLQRMSPAPSLPAAVYPLPGQSLADAESPFELSRRVCLCFELLTEPSPRHSRYSRNSPPSALSAGEQGGSSSSASFAPPPLLLSTPRSPFPAARRRSHRSSPQSIRSAASARRGNSTLVTADSHPLFTPSSSYSVRHRFAGLTPAAEAPPVSASSPALSALLESFSSSQLSLLPFGVSLPLYQLLYDARAAPSASLSPSELELIGRRELSRMKQATAASVAASFSPSLQDKMEAAAGRPHLLTVPPPPTAAAADDAGDADGTLLTLRQASFRFGSDLRLKQVRHLLRSSRVVSLSLTRARLTEIEASNGALDLLYEQQKRLALLSRRILALPVARGMFTLASTSPLLTSTFPIPPLTLSAHAQPKQTRIDLNLAIQPADFTDWPSFHNGVAAALRIRPGAPAASSASLSPLSSASASSSSISSSFILYNKPASLTYAHGGWLLGLGLLCGGLSCLSTADVYRYLSAHHEGVTIGLLLGLSCARRRSMDVMVSKMLCLHVPAFLPAHLESEISLQVKTAAVVGIGLLYEGSAHRLMTEVLLGEISSRAAREKVKGEGERSGYALAAGMGLGLVLLGRGAEAVGVSDLRIEDRLIALLHGGLRETEDKEAVASGAGGGGGLLLDVDVTAPAATVALSLMYLGSNNADVASHLLIPRSHYELDAVKTDFLLLRTLARALILWDDVQPNRDWVEKQLPPVMTDSVLGMEHYCNWPDGSPAAGARPVAAEKQRTQATAASSSAAQQAGEEHRTAVDEFDIDSIALNSDDERAYSARQPQPRTAGRRPSARRDRFDSDSDDEAEEDEVDYEACRQGYCNIIAGSCLALGLKFAGTADASACTVIAYYLRCFRAIRQRHSDGGHALLSSTPSPLQLLDRHTLETCVLSCMLALAAVMAGTGDLQTLRLFLSLRQRMDERQTVGRLQAFWMAFGLLFLGGGEWSLKRGRDAVSGLLLSLYPLFSASPSTGDNRLLLQALRHLYALSVECRAMKAVDVEGGKESYCQLQLRLKDGRLLRLVTPCTLPHIDSIHSVTVVDPRYLPITATFASSSASSAAAAASPSSFTFPLSTSSPYVLHVQRCSAYVLRDLDSASFVDLLSRLSQQREAVLLDGQALPLAASDSGLAAAEDSRMLQAVCDSEDVLTAYRWIVGEEAEDRGEEAALLLDCVREDKLQLLPVLLRIRRLLSTGQQPGAIDASAIWNLRCLLAFYQSRLQAASPSAAAPPSLPPPLLSPSTMSASEQRLLSLCGALTPESVSLLRGYVDGRDAGEQRRELAAYLTCFDLPSAGALRAAIALMRQLLSELSAGRPAMLRDDVHSLLPMASMLFPRLSAAAVQQVMAVALDRD